MEDSPWVFYCNWYTQHAPVESHHIIVGVFDVVNVTVAHQVVRSIRNSALLCPKTQKQLIDEWHDRKWNADKRKLKDI